MVVEEKETTQGFKETKLGLIPNDWHIHTIGNLVFNVEYGSSAKSKKVGKVPVLRMGNIQDGKIDWNDLVYTDDENEINKYLLRKNDVLFNRTNSIDLVGKTAIYKSELPAIFAGYLIRINIKDFLLDAEYLNFFLNTEQAKKYGSFVVSIAVGQANINGAKLKTYPIPLPPTLDEQRAIATALSDVDALITSLDALIVKKRNIKQGAMKQLLSGKKRLPGFSGEWIYKKFGDVISGFSSGSTPSRSNSNYYKGKVKWITSGELNYNVIVDTIEKISEEAVKNTNLKVHPKGTFLMAITGLEAEGTRGSCGITGVEATTNQSCMALFPTEELLTDYLYHYYVYYGNELAFQYCQGTKQQSYTAKLVKILPISLPPTLDEQRAIARILSDMDTEIEALEKKRDKYKTVKQGMMQQLLTGKIRLVQLQA